MDTVQQETLLSCLRWEGDDNVLANRRAHMQGANNWGGRALTWDFMVNNSHFALYTISK